MKRATATLVSHNTKDGASFVYDQVPIGKQYTVDLDSIAVDTYFNTKRETVTDRESIHVENDDGSWGIMPTELLHIQVESKDAPIKETT